MSDVPEKPALRFGKRPRRGRHLYAVARFDGLGISADPTDAFALTRGYWREEDAESEAKRLNALSEGADTRYFVLPVRISESTDA